MKIAGSGSGSKNQRHGSADPDPCPHQNVMDLVSRTSCCCCWPARLLWRAHPAGRWAGLTGWWRPATWASSWWRPGPTNSNLTFRPLSGRPSGPAASQSSPTGDYADKKGKKIFLIYKEIQSSAVAKSYMRKGFLIYEEMRKYFPIH
jgi:hypothetical protein